MFMRNVYPRTYRRAAALSVVTGFARGAARARAPRPRAAGARQPRRQTRSYRSRCWQLAGGVRGRRCGRRYRCFIYEHGLRGVIDVSVHRNSGFALERCLNQPEHLPVIPQFRDHRLRAGRRRALDYRLQQRGRPHSRIFKAYLGSSCAFNFDSLECAA